MWKNFLFPQYPKEIKTSYFLLAVRIIFGVLLMTHGWQKFTHFSEMSGVFPDPLGIGSQTSMALAIFGELFCSIAFIFGFLFRLSTIPMIFTMCIAFFNIHMSDPFAVKELAFVYLVIFLLMYIAGPGKFAIDQYFSAKLHSK